MTKQQRFEEFTKALTELSKKHGFVLQAIGGVYELDPKDPTLENLRYMNDATSGDLEPLNFFEEYGESHEKI